MASATGLLILVSIAGLALAPHVASGGEFATFCEPFSIQLDPASDTGRAIDNVTNDTTPTFSGNLNNTGCSKVELLGSVDNFMVKVGENIVSGDSYSVTSTHNFAGTSEAGDTHNFRVRGVGADENGNSSDQNIVIDDNRPEAPSIPDLVPTSDTGVSNGDNLTHDTTPVFRGTGEQPRLISPPVSVQVGYLAPCSSGPNCIYALSSNTPDQAGHWRGSNASPLPTNADYDVVAYQIDAAGNAGPVTDSVKVSILPPPMCQGQPATIIRTAASETINGTTGADVIHAFGGDDTINGKGGNDLVCAGDGNDTVNAGEGADRVRGGPGGDRLRGDPGNDKLYGEAGADTLSGGQDGDDLDGGSGADECIGGPNAAANPDTAVQCEQTSGVP
ncbi:MAG: Ig-like domain-containing protein [Dehalococcoidia bacterium]